MSRRYGRDSVEFARVLSFTDGLFAISIPFAFLSTTLAVLIWLGTAPVGVVM